MSEAYQSWGGYPRAADQAVRKIHWRDQVEGALQGNGTVLPRGAGRSYGDVCLNEGGELLDMQGMDRFIAFDETEGIVRCEAGVTLAHILQLVVPRGWFLPVTPGTKYVTVGGAIANDVHGKNSQVVGTFGCHVRAFELIRSTGEALVCTPTQNQALFQATIGGLGLTGVVTWAEIQLQPIATPYMDAEYIRFAGLETFLTLSAEARATHPYVVAWIDTSQATQVRGIFMQAKHAPVTEQDQTDTFREPRLTFPVYAPNWLISLPVIRLFNMLYYRRQFQERVAKQVHYDPFFYPLDIVQYWNRLYGRRGMQSYQTIVPQENGVAVIEEMLRVIHAGGLASPLTVLKLFGEVQSPGMLSFPRPGINLLLDFPNVGGRLQRVLNQLDTITAQAGGRVNPAKDAHMSADHWDVFYPHWREFTRHIDPQFSSQFWRRVTS